MRHIYINLLLLSVLTIGLSACLDEEFTDKIDGIIGYKPDPLVVSKVSLRQSESCNDFKQYLTTSLVDQYLENQGGRWGWCPNCRFTINEGDVSILPVPTASPVNGNSSGTGAAEDSTSKQIDPSSVTGTNNQVTGVDELDKLKTDSKGNMFLIRNRELVIVDAYPAQDMTISSRLVLKTSPSGLFIDEKNQRAIIIGLDWVEATDQTQKKLVGGDASSRRVFVTEPKVVLSFVDISDLAKPKIVDELRIDGNFQSARMIDDRLHLVINYWLKGIEESFNSNKFEKDLERYWKAKELDFATLEKDIAQLRESLAEKIAEGIEGLDLSELFPYYQRTNEERKSALLSCTQIYHPDLSLKSSSLLSVVSLDSDGSALSSAATFSSGGIVYASSQSVYIAQSNGAWWGIDSKQQMAIHKFSLTETSTEYVASGLVAGAAQTSFNFSEYEGNLRVATTETRWPDDARGRITYNNLFILKDDGEGSLAISGAVENFAKNESIMSARFLGDKGFIVTFERIDPLFTFDLSDATQPVLMGELEIPGFSSYMHPIGENYLLTIGRSGTDDGRIEDTQLQLFDISDLSRPVRLAAHIPDVLKNNEAYGYSIAEADPHAFTYSAIDNILAIPLSINNWKSKESFAGIVTFNIDVKNGEISENGAIDHSSFFDIAECDIKSIEGNIKFDNQCVENFYRWDARPNRSVITHDEDGTSQLYSISQLGIKASDLNDMAEELAALPLNL